MATAAAAQSPPLPAVDTLARGLEHRVLRASELYRQKKRTPPATLPTAVEALDRLLGGGLPRGGLVELVGRRSSGRFSLCLAALAATTTSGRLAALVDLADGFDPRLAKQAGVVLERLLWLRPQHLKTALAGVEMVLDSGFALAVLDLGLPPVPGGRGSETSWVRLARATAAHRSSLLVSCPYRVTMTAASAVIETPGCRPVWQGRGHSPRWLAGARGRLALTKSRDARTGAGGGGDGLFRLLAPESLGLGMDVPATGTERPAKASWAG